MPDVRLLTGEKKNEIVHMPAAKAKALVAHGRVELVPPEPPEPPGRHAAVETPETPEDTEEAAVKPAPRRRRRAPKPETR
jgi:hypothetical protein